jgi:hypothetical protein
VKSLENSFPPSGRQKYDLSEVDKAMFQGVDKPWELIFYFLGIQKSTFNEVAELIF